MKRRYQRIALSRIPPKDKFLRWELKADKIFCEFAFDLILKWREATSKRRHFFVSVFPVAGIGFHHFSSNFTLTDQYNNPLLVDTTILVSKSCLNISEQVDIIRYYSNGITPNFTFNWL